jgi:hypothetical protein
MKDLDPLGASEEIMGDQEASSHGITLAYDDAATCESETIFDILAKDEELQLDSMFFSCDLIKYNDCERCNDVVKGNALNHSDDGSRETGHMTDTSAGTEEHQKSSNSTWSQSDMSDETAWSGLPSLCDLQRSGLIYHRLEHVCDMLGVGITTFKKHLRHLGLPRWPYRHLKSMQRMRERIKVL